jgi:hypothetical protein
MVLLLWGRIGVVMMIGMRVIVSHYQTRRNAS